MHFRVLISCIFNRQNCEIFILSVVRVIVWELLAVQHIDGPLQVKYWVLFDPCNVDAYETTKACERMMIEVTRPTTKRRFEKDEKDTAIGKKLCTLRFKKPDPCDVFKQLQ